MEILETHGKDSMIHSIDLQEMESKIETHLGWLFQVSLILTEDQVVSVVRYDWHIMCSPKYNLFI